MKKIQQINIFFHFTDTLTACCCKDGRYLIFTLKIYDNGMTTNHVYSNWQMSGSQISKWTDKNGS